MLPKTLALKEQGIFVRLQKNRPRIFVFKGGPFLNRYNHKGQGKYSLYTQYTGVFENLAKPLFVRVIAFCVNNY